MNLVEEFINDVLSKSIHLRRDKDYQVFEICITKDIFEERLKAISMNEYDEIAFFIRMNISDNDLFIGKESYIQNGEFYSTDFYRRSIIKFNTRRHRKCNH